MRHYFNVHVGSLRRHHRHHDGHVRQGTVMEVPDEDHARQGVLPFTVHLTFDKKYRCVQTSHVYLYFIPPFLYYLPYHPCLLSLVPPTLDSYTHPFHNLIGTMANHNQELMRHTCYLITIFSTTSTPLHSMTSIHPSIHPLSLHHQ